MSFACDCSCSRARRVSKFNSKEPQNLGRVHVYIMFMLLAYAVVATLKTIISHNTAFGDIITNTKLSSVCIYHI